MYKKHDVQVTVKALGPLVIKHFRITLLHDFDVRLLVEFVTRNDRIGHILIFVPTYINGVY